MNRNLEKEYKFAVKLKSQHSTKELDDLIEELLTDIVNSHKGYLYKMALRQNRQFAEDYTQAGVIGIMKALDKFDENKDVKFLTFATWYIKKEMNKFDRVSTGNMVLPDNVHSLMKGYVSQIDKNVEEFVGDRKISKGSVSKNIANRIENILNVEYIKMESISYENRDRFDSIKDDIYKCIDKRRADIIIWKTIGIQFLEIAPKLNISAERVKQLYYDGLKKLRNNVEFCKIWEGVV